ncbi:MAG: DNA polymerase III subunit gamma/tau [Clostridia bacterium]|nr:DNA polymerase III subunit gamma/tau [Clostridia bacterium]
MYLALYRKYRPKTFEEVIGQDHIIRTLKNQISMDKVGHAYLFCGSRGTGKTSTAKIFAREVNCTCGHTGKCLFCKDEQTLDILEIDAASNNGVDEIRALREKIKYPPVDGKYKVYIIDEVHMLSPSAFNALLKTLEEPPKHALFILATTEVHKLPATILSRCMRFDFKLVSIEELSKLLEKIFKSEKIEYDEQSIALIARAGEGSVRDTLSIADRCTSYAEGKLTREKVVEVLGETEKQSLISLADAILVEGLGASMLKLDQILSGGKSPLVLANDLIFYFRDLLLINVLKKDSEKIIVANNADLEKMKAQATDENYAKIAKAIDVLSSVEQELRYSAQPRIVLEECIIKLFTQVNLLERIEKLEKMLASGVVVESPKQDVIKPKAKAEEPIIEPVHISKDARADDKLLGELLNYLREQKLMSLLMATRQINKILIDGGCAELYLRDKSAISMISSAKYKPELDEFFSRHNLTWKIISNAAAQSAAGSLSSKLGGKLDIK